MIFNCGCELRSDGTFSERCIIHQNEDLTQHEHDEMWREAQEEITRLRADNSELCEELTNQARRANRLKTKVKWRGEMLRACDPHLRRSQHLARRRINEKPTAKAIAVEIIEDAEVLRKQIKALTDEN